MATIFTGCFFKEYPGKVRVSIARSEPRGFETLYSINQLAPSAALLRDYKAGKIDVGGYTQRYREGVLDKLDKGAILNAIELVSERFGGQPVVLCCWEKTGFCHRHLVADWLGITEAV